MVDNIVAPDLAGKTINLPHRNDWAKALPDGDPTNTVIDEDHQTVTFGADGKAEVGAAWKTAVILHYPNVQAI